MQDQVSVLCVIPISRAWALNHLFNSIMALEIPPHVTLSFQLYIDNNNPDLKHGVRYWVNELIERGHEVLYWQSDRPALNDMKTELRRKRIADIHNDLASLLHGREVDYIFGVEDDTILPAYALSRMLTFMQRNPQAGLVTGVQVGRHGYKMVGAWRLDDLHKPTRLISMPWTPVNREHSMIEQIDGAGLYCYLTPTKLFTEAQYRNEGEAFAVDALYGIDLRRQGYVNYIDWSIVCGHNDYGQVLSPDDGAPMEQVLWTNHGTIRKPDWQFSVVSTAPVVGQSPAETQDTPKK